MSAGEPDGLGRFTKDEIDELIRDAVGPLEPDRFDELVAAAVTAPRSTLAHVTPARHGALPTGATRWLAVAAAAVVVLAGSVVVLTSRGGDDTLAAPPADERSTTAVASPTTVSGPPPSSSVTTGSTLPADFLDRLGRSGVTDEERACIDRSSSVSIANYCLSLDTLVGLQESYLREETDATDEQIKCVLDAVRALGVTEARSLSDASLATQIYRPCGLPQ